MADPVSRSARPRPIRSGRGRCLCSENHRRSRSSGAADCRRGCLGRPEGCRRLRRLRRIRRRCRRPTGARRRHYRSRRRPRHRGRSPDRCSGPRGRPPRRSMERLPPGPECRNRRWRRPRHRPCRQRDPSRLLRRSPSRASSSSGRSWNRLRHMSASVRKNLSPYRIRLCDCYEHPMQAVSRIVGTRQVLDAEP